MKHKETMEDKIQKLQTVTDEAASKLDEYKVNLDNAIQKLDATKDRLRSSINVPDATGQKINTNSPLLVTDTDLPEVIDLKMRAQEEYDVAKKRYETNLRYLKKLLQKKKDDENDTVTDKNTNCAPL